MKKQNNNNNFPGISSQIITTTTTTQQELYIYLFYDFISFRFRSVSFLANLTGKIFIAV